MIPIHQLLARIRWDPQFGQGRFEIAYFDREKRALVRVPLERVVARPGEHFSFDAIDEDGVAHSIPDEAGCVPSMRRPAYALACLAWRRCFPP